MTGRIPPDQPRKATKAHVAAAVALATGVVTWAATGEQVEGWEENVAELAVWAAGSAAAWLATYWTENKPKPHRGG